MRLKDLEDETKSSVSVDVESQLISSLRKDLAKAELDKANLEREFMNQMSSLSIEKQAQVEAVKQKLAKEESEKAYIVKDLQERLRLSDEMNRALKLKVEEHRQNNNGEQYLELLEQERKVHIKEMEQMKNNLASTDLEIAESRREMDHLQDQLFDSQAEKIALEEELAKVRTELDKGIHRYETLETQLTSSASVIERLNNDLCKKKEEIGGMNDTIIELEEQKKVLVSDMTELRVELQRVEHENSSLKERLYHTNHPCVGTGEVISASEKLQLENSVAELEERLQLFSEKLAARDGKIERLSAALAEERKTNMKLVKELNDSASGSRSTREMSEEIQTENVELFDELKTLRNENTVLNQEIKSLRERFGDDYQNGPSNVSKVPRYLASISRSSDAHRQNLPLRKGAGIVPGSPAKISGIVATFERRIATSGKQMSVGHSDKKPFALSDDDQSQSSHWQSEAPDMDAIGEDLNNERTKVKKLQQGIGELAFTNIEKTQKCTELENLQNELNEERKKVKRLQREIHKEFISHTENECNGIDSKLDSVTLYDKRFEAKEITDRVAGLEAELLNCRAILESERAASATLQTLINELEAEKVERINTIERHELKNLELSGRLRAMEEEIEELRLIIRNLKMQLHDLETKAAKAEEEKNKILSESSREICELKASLAAVKSLNVEEEKKEGHDEELIRLRDQVMSLQPELDNALLEIETQKSMIVGLHGALDRAKQGEELSKEYDALKSKLSRLQFEKAGVELELTNKITDLEHEIEVLEDTAEEEIEEKEKEIAALRSTIEYQEQEIKRLEDEKSQAYSNLNNVSSSRKGEIEELQCELMDVMTTSKSQEREIESLKRKLDEVRNTEMDNGLKRRLKELEEELKFLKANARNSSQQEDLENLTTENSKLRDVVRELKLERGVLQDRLDTLLVERSSSKSAQVLRDRNAALKQEVEKLTKKLKKMEESITRFAI